MLHRAGHVMSCAAVWLVTTDLADILSKALHILHTLTLSARFSSQSPSEKVLKSPVLLGLSGGLWVGLPVGLGVADTWDAAPRALAICCAGFLGVRAGCMHKISVKAALDRWCNSRSQTIALQINVQMSSCCRMLQAIWRFDCSEVHQGDVRFAIVTGCNPTPGPCVSC